MTCRRTIFEATSIEHCRDGVIVGHTCGKSMQHSCRKLSLDRRARPTLYKALSKTAREALAKKQQQ